MDSKRRTLILILMLLALAASLYLLFTGGEFLRRDPGEPAPTDFIKPTTGILESMRGTATAEAEQATPEPQAERPGTKTTPRPSLWEWWEQIKLEQWGSA